jgi:CheY-like chemotaxis protein
MCAAQSVRPIEILLVEDNPGDVDLTRMALKDSKIYNLLSVVDNGVDAMDFLKCKGKYTKASRPDLVLLDLNLPKKDGREVLNEIKSDDDLKRIPVVVLTSSKDEEDILRAYNLHANSYVTKPMDLDQFFKVVQSIEDFWFTIVILPPRVDKQ